MTRFPHEGKVKTRLVPTYGAKGACDLHNTMTKFALNECLSVGHVQVHYLESNAKDMYNWLGSVSKAHQNDHSLEFIPQSLGDLGDKMFSAISHAFHSILNATKHNLSRQKVILIGSDCPNNRRDNLQLALDSLDEHDCVIGPSNDGGYYLIGFASNAQNAKELNFFLQQVMQPVFQNIDWGTESVFAQSIKKITNQSLKYSSLQALSDVDTYFDVPEKISVIIPTLNEEKNIKELFATLPPAFNFEVIVSDAHSHDKTCDIASFYSATCIQSAAGRSQQIQNAISKTTGNILLFLHADSSLPAKWDIKIRHILADKNCSLGYFTFGIKEYFWTRPIIEWGVKFRCKYFKLPFGDQGLFVRKSDFLKWDLQQVPILEDVFLVKCAQKYGKILPIDDKLLTSGRRWFKYGFIRTTVMNASVLFCSKLGMNLEDIKQAYWQGQNPIKFYIQKKLNIVEDHNA